MFEYLMPRLLLAPAPDTLLDVAEKATVVRQIEYGRQTRDAVEGSRNPVSMC